MRLLDRLLDAVHTEGLHIVLYGDRGTGKTSLARVVAYLAQESDDPRGLRCIVVSCSADDSFASIWRKVGQEVLLSHRPLGFARLDVPRVVGRLDLDSAILSPSDVLLFLGGLDNGTVIILDEFDRLADGDVRALMADTIKFFSDHMVPSTLLLVGVGKSLSDLLHEHLSISRNIAQVHIGPMSAEGLTEIIGRGYEGVGLGFEPGLDEEVATLSQGYPYYAHLLGLWAGRRVVDDDREFVTIRDLHLAIPDALLNAEGGLREQYDRAVDSTNPSALFRQVFLASALAHKDSLGRFPVRAIREPLRLVTGQTYGTGAYQTHLGRFCELERGPVLERSGVRRNYRWRFLNPQLIPYVILRGISDEMIGSSDVIRFHQP